jgi:CheY-like chemotaxis protein
MRKRKEFLVLVVEDEFLLRMELAEELGRAGWRVLEAANGADAITRLDYADFLITDIRLPGAMNGWDLAEAARKIHPTMPVIYVSANPIDPARQVENSAFLSKPIDLRLLLQTCEQLVLGQ